MFFLLCHWSIVVLIYLFLFGMGKLQAPLNPTTLRGKISRWLWFQGKVRFLAWWGMFYGFWFALAISIGFIVDCLAGGYCGHLATGIGFFATVYQARKIQNK